jgi:phage tail sheath gpL-like
MPTSTYIPLSTITLGANAAAVTFSSISQAYRDLILVVNAGTTATSGAGGAGLFAQFNGDTGTNYSTRVASSNGTATPASSVSNVNNVYLTYYVVMDENKKASVTANIMDYSATDKHKTVIHRLDMGPNGSSTLIQDVSMMTNRWASTAAITSIKVYSQNGQLTANSTFSLYGIGA